MGSRSPRTIDSTTEQIFRLPITEQSISGTTNGRIHLNMQGKSDLCQVYMYCYVNCMNVISHLGGKLPDYPALVEAALKDKRLRQECHRNAQPSTRLQLDSFL